jgi:hypothetical protein
MKSRPHRQQRPNLPLEGSSLESAGFQLQQHKASTRGTHIPRLQCDKAWINNKQQIRISNCQAHELTISYNTGHAWYGPEVWHSTPTREGPRSSPRNPCIFPLITTHFGWTFNRSDFINLYLLCISTWKKLKGLLQKEKVTTSLWQIL